MKIQFFKSQAAFRKWLASHGSKESEIEVGFYKVGSGKEGLTYKQAVDEALCAGWIDGVRHAIDAVSYRQRFTPRQRSSTWSQVNLKRVKELEAAELMTERGLEVLRNRDPRAQNRYSFENRDKGFSPAQRRTFLENPKAWAYYEAQPPWYRRVSAWWVISAKKEETRDRRLGTLIATSRKGDWIPGLKRPGKK